MSDKDLFPSLYSGISSVFDRTSTSTELELAQLADSYSAEIVQFADESDAIINDGLAWVSEGALFEQYRSFSSTILFVKKSRRKRVFHQPSGVTTKVRLPSGLEADGEPFVIMNGGPGLVTVENSSRSPLGASGGTIQPGKCQWYYLIDQASNDWLVLGPFTFYL